MKTTLAPRAMVFALATIVGCDSSEPRLPLSAHAAALLRDEPGILEGDPERRVRAYLRWVRQEYGIDYRVVVTSVAAEPVEAVSNRLFTVQGIGEETGGRGLLLVVGATGHEVRVEVGYALEPYLTDVAASRMITDYLAPYFQVGDRGAGIEAAVEALVDEMRPQLETLRAERSGRALIGDSAGSGGGGATTDLTRDLPEGPMTPETEKLLQRIAVPQPGPRQARDLEIALMHQGIYYGEGALYDAAWRRADRPQRWSASRLREIAGQWDRPYEVRAEGGLAIAYYGDAPALGPTFLRREPAGWIIDATATAETIVYDYSNEAWYAVDAGSPYLPILRRALDLSSVTLQDGRRAWTIDAASNSGL